MIVICIFLSLTIISAVNYMKTRRKRALITNISGPLALPLIGSVHKFLLLTPQNFLTKSRNYLNKFGTLSHCWLFERLFVLTADYEFVTQLLHSTDHLTTGYNNLLQPVFGNGMLRRDGEEWQQRRQLITHGLQPQTTLNDFVQVFATQADVLCEQLRVECDGKSSFDIQPYVEIAVYDVLSATVLGVEGRAPQSQQVKPVKLEYAKAVFALIDLITSRFLSLHSANYTIYSILCPLQKRRQRYLLNTINRINNDLISDQRAAAAAGDKTSEETYTIQVNDESHNEMRSTQRHGTLLKILCAAHIAGEPLSNAEICDELNTFILQGCLLTPAAISFALVMIARHPSVQQKLLTELREIWPKGTNVCDFTMDNLLKLKYLENVINETLRLYPPQPIIARDLKHNFNYTHSQYKDGVLPAESEIYINVFEMLRLPESFADPECFRPERFDAALTNASTDMVAWGLGPRNCVAKKCTMLLMKTVIAQLLLAYEILPFGEELRLEVKIVLRSSNGWQVGLRAHDD
ncbi:probable cytochrome P450 316a1 [Eurosta solidaginis]|uniref:probable cytochrome P450 316a1 n=1 Tax=Eurosta solidaginis TaxID=178769 RepID=UPI0035313E95